MTTAPAARYWCELALVDGAVLRAVALEVADGRFTSVLPGVEPSHDSVRLAGLTIPGLANAHSHAFHRALRSRTQADRGTFWTWRELMYRAAARLQPENYHRLARGVFGEMGMAGITTVGEFHYLHHQCNGTPYENRNDMGDALLEAASDAGIRITLLDTLYLHGGLDEGGYQQPNSAQRRFSDGDVSTWAERVSSLRSTDSQRIGAAIHSIRAVDPTSIRIASQWASDSRAPLHAHVSEQVAENEACIAYHGGTPVAVLAEAGAIGDRFAAVHATHLVDGDIAALATSGSSVVICPTTERDLGDGIGPTHRFAESGIAMSLGSDSHAVIDILEEARALELDERLRSQQRGIHSASDLLTMATENGHRALGWDDVGSIRIGHRADLVTIALDSVRTAGTSTSTAGEAAVFAADASDVTDVFVDGRHIVSDRRHATIDVPAELGASIKDLMDP